MTVQRRFTILLHPDLEGTGFTVTVPALPGCVTQGATIEEAIAMARDAIQLHVEGMIADGELVPEETAPIQALMIDVAA